MIDWFIANWTEALGFVTGAVCVLLAGRRNIWNFPIGIANNLVFIVLFVGSALYADAGLQVVYLVLGVQGWIAWGRRGSEMTDDGSGFARRTPVRAILPLVLAAVVGAAVLTWVLTAFTNSTTQLADGSTTAVSLVAQYMLNRRWIENWFVWLAVDLVYIALYMVKGLWITGALYLLFVALCIGGYRAWRRHPVVVVRGGAEPVAALPEAS